MCTRLTLDKRNPTNKLKAETMQLFDLPLNFNKQNTKSGKSFYSAFRFAAKGEEFLGEFKFLPPSI